MKKKKYDFFLFKYRYDPEPGDVICVKESFYGNSTVKLELKAGMILHVQSVDGVGDIQVIDDMGILTRTQWIMRRNFHRLEFKVIS